MVVLSRLRGPLSRPMWVSKDSAPYEANVMFIDPSGRGKDETAYAGGKAPARPALPRGERPETMVR